MVLSSQLPPHTPCPLGHTESTELPQAPPIMTLGYLWFRRCAHTGNTISRRPYGQPQSVLSSAAPGRLPRPNWPVARVMYGVAFTSPLASSTHTTICKLYTAGWKRNSTAPQGGSPARATEGASSETASSEAN